MREQIVHDLVENFKELGANVNIKLHYLNNPLQRFTENLVDEIDANKGTGFIKI